MQLQMMLAVQGHEAPQKELSWMIASFKWCAAAGLLPDVSVRVSPGAAVRLPGRSTARTLCLSRGSILAHQGAWLSRGDHSRSNNHAR